MKKTYIIVALLTLIILTGCTSEYEPEDLINCNEGKYKVINELEGHFRASGIEVKNMEIIKTIDSCSLIINFKRPVNVLGVEIKTYPILVCQDDCIDSVINEYNKDAATAISYCCEE